MHSPCRCVIFQHQLANLLSDSTSALRVSVLHVLQAKIVLPKPETRRPLELVIYFDAWLTMCQGRRSCEFFRRCIESCEMWAHVFVVSLGGTAR